MGGILNVFAAWSYNESFFFFFFLPVPFRRQSGRQQPPLSYRHTSSGQDHRA